MNILWQSFFVLIQHYLCIRIWFKYKEDDSFFKAFILVRLDHKQTVKFALTIRQTNKKQLFMAANKIENQNRSSLKL